MESLIDVIIVGGGPASCSAAIQLKRSNVNFVLITENIGGLVRNANLIENLLGFPQGISGQYFTELLYQHLNREDIKPIFSKIIEIRQKDLFFEVKTSNSSYNAKYIILGSGTLPNTLNISGEDEAYQNNFLFYEIWDKFKILSKKEIIIVGSGDAAYDYAINLSKICSKIKIIQRKDNSNALELLQNRVQAIKNIQIIKSTVLVKIQSKNEKISAECFSTEKISILSSEFLIVAIGRRPNLDLLDSSLIHMNIAELKRIGIFCIGDVVNSTFRQISIAMGDGIQTAMELLTKFK